MITSKDLHLLIARAESGTRKNTKAELTWFQRMKDEAAKMREVEDAEKCWLRRCNSPVAVRLDMGYQLHLCSAHGHELEENADEAGQGVPQSLALETPHRVSYVLQLSYTVSQSRSHRGPADLPPPAPDHRALLPAPLPDQPGHDPVLPGV